MLVEFAVGYFLLHEFYLNREILNLCLRTKLDLSAVATKPYAMQTEKK